MHLYSCHFSLLSLRVLSSCSKKPLCLVFTHSLHNSPILPLLCSSEVVERGRERERDSGRGRPGDRKEGGSVLYVGEGSTAISGKDSCDALLHTRTHTALWHSENRRLVLLVVGTLMYPAIAPQVKPGCRQWEGSRGDNVWIQHLTKQSVSQSDVHTLLGDTKIEKRLLQTDSPSQLYTHTVVHALFPVPCL